MTTQSPQSDPPKTPATIAVAMSGGVDSTVSAWLLKRRGNPVVGIFMNNWNEDRDTSACSAAEDHAEAQRACDALGMDLHVVDFSYEYWQLVFEPYLKRLQQGLTPNPDVACNRHIKFDYCLRFAQDLGATHLATGHYARTRVHDKRLQLLQAADSSRDQSYFLYDVNADALAHCVFPLANLHKTEVRSLAHEQGFANHARAESRGICFIGKRSFAEFMARFIPPTEGPIVSLDCKEIGQHDGLHQFSIGQRQGLGLGGGSGDAWFVCGKRLNDQALIVVQGREHDALFSHRAEIAEPKWLEPELAFGGIIYARSRHLQPLQPCWLEPMRDTSRNDASRPGGITVHFLKPQHALTPGQAMVFYHHHQCLGGGMISQSHSLCGPVLQP